MTDADSILSYQILPSMNVLRLMLDQNDKDLLTRFFWNTKLSFSRN